MEQVFSHIVICEECAFAVDLREPGTSLDGWAIVTEAVGDPPHQYPIYRGSVCDICFAKMEAKSS